MRGRVITILAILAALVGWWGLYELTSIVTPDQPGALSFFFALLFLAVTATLIPPMAYLNRRFAPEATSRDPWRFLRYSGWGGICVASWALANAISASKTNGAGIFVSSAVPHGSP